MVRRCTVIVKSDYFRQFPPPMNILLSFVWASRREFGSHCELRPDERFSEHHGTLYTQLDEVVWADFTHSV